MEDNFDKHQPTLPTFMVIGAPRCGSTALCRALGKHPNVYFSSPKETFFFSIQRKYNSKERWDWYRSLFSAAGPEHLAIGEGTTDYSDPGRLQVILPRLLEHVPECRLIYIVRHPLKRIESAWKLSVTRMPGQSLTEYIESHRKAVEFSSYWKVLDGYTEAFGRDRILVVFNEEFKSRPENVLRHCFEHIAVDATVPVNAGEIVNSSTGLRRRSRLVNKVRKSPLGVCIRRALPEAAKEALHRAATTEYVPEPVWDATTARSIVSELRQGIARFLLACGKPEDYWKL